MTRILLLLASFVALAVPPATATATAVEPQQCGGLSPLISECTFGGTLQAVNDLLVEGGIFAGDIVVVIKTERGQYNARCTLVPFVLAECTESTSGVLVPGDAYVLNARTSLAVGRTDLRGMAPGRWRVTFS